MARACQSGAVARTTQAVEVDGRVLALSNLEKVLYPATGTTKAEVIAYYTQVASVLLPLVADRPVTRKRWPDGVEGEPFFEKNAPQGTPEWVRTVRLPAPGSSKDRGEIDYALIFTLADLVWTANLAALEIHVPQWTVGPRGAVRGPNRLVVDLDPGAPAGLAECVEVALAVRDRVAQDGLECYPVTSGGKGMQLYAPIAGTQDATAVHGYARGVAEELERAMPRLVVSRMTKALRPGKVLVDWSQNHPAKTTISPYSLRGREHPTVAAPRTWAELEAASTSAGLTQMEDYEVTERLATDGDLLAPLLRKGPRLPAA
jgi:bifunctional non-homologous end joining protein LigD